MKFLLGGDIINNSTKQHITAIEPRHQSPRAKQECQTSEAFWGKFLFHINTTLGNTGPVSLLFTAVLTTISSASGQSLLFRKEIPISTFSGILVEMWLVLCPFFFSTLLTLRVVWVRTLSGRTLAGLPMEQLEVQELTATPSPGLCLNWKQRSQLYGPVDNGFS